MSARNVERLLAGAGLEPAECGGIFESLCTLAELGEGSPPEPSAELARLLAGVAVAGSTTSSAVPLRTHRRRVAAGALTMALAAVAITGAAAAANELPAELQRALSRFSHRHLPFELPLPGVDRVPASPTPPRDVVPTPPARPAAKGGGGAQEPGGTAASASGGSGSQGKGGGPETGPRGQHGPGPGAGSAGDHAAGDHATGHRSGGGPGLGGGGGGGKPQPTEPTHPPGKGGASGAGPGDVPGAVSRGGPGLG